MLADCVRDRVAALQDFLADTRAGLKNKHRMREGVIADHVTLPGDRLRDIWTLLDVASNQKESRLDAVLAQDVKQPQCVRIVRPIVKSEGDLF